MQRQHVQHYRITCRRHGWTCGVEMQPRGFLGLGKPTLAASPLSLCSTLASRRSLASPRHATLKQPSTSFSLPTPACMLACSVTQHDNKRHKKVKTIQLILYPRTQNCLHHASLPPPTTNHDAQMLANFQPKNQTDFLSHLPINQDPPYPSPLPISLSPRYPHPPISLALLPSLPPKPRPNPALHPQEKKES